MTPEENIPVGHNVGHNTASNVAPNQEHHDVTSKSTATSTPKTSTPETFTAEISTTETSTTDVLVQMRDDSVDALVQEPLTRDSLARAKQHLNLRHPNTLFLLFRWLLRGSWAITKREASKRIDYGSKHDLTLQDGTGEAKVSVPVNYALGVSVFFPMAALLVWLFTKVSDYEFAITEGYAVLTERLTEGSSHPELSSHTPATTLEGAP